MLKEKKISVILPAYNEAATIGDVIEAMPDYVDRIIVVDDGSTDETLDIAERKGAEVCRHATNRGVGAAFSTGMRAALAARSDITVSIDADGQFDPRDIGKLIDPIIDGQVEFVTASRFKDRSLYPEMGRVKFYGNKLMSFVISTMTGQKFFDVSCGFRAYSRNALLKLNLFSDFTYTQETFLNFAFKRVPIMEVPVMVKGRREHGSSRVAGNLFRYGYQTVKIIIKTLRDYRPFRLFAAVSLALFIVGLAFAVFLAIHYSKSGTFTPHKWAGFTAGFLFLLSAMSFILGFILDMFARMRLNQEEILFHLERRRD
ncbi:MAG: glycosyltransferase family 2 protein [candidate division WOR-3 bacterium]|nr:MAG: glycosyltransferase family 2 protein [candidate division WOR-3 bacterium]UCF06913.1 MAG: glycosyltransferase family 2 protein [bacterium]